MFKFINDFIKWLIRPFVAFLLKRYSVFFFDSWKKANDIQLIPAIGNDGIYFPRARLNPDPHSTFYSALNPDLYVNIDDCIFLQVISKQQWDFDKVEMFVRHISGKNVGLIDIGANAGLFTRQVLIASSGISHAYCFEPNKANCQLIAKNLEGFPNFSIYEYGLSDRDGTSDFMVDMGNSGNLSINESAMLGRDYLVGRVELKRPDITKPPFETIMQNHDTLVYKSDTQGFDEAIFTFLGLEFWKKVECALIEIYRIPDKQVEYERMEEIIQTCFTKIYSVNRKSFISFEELREYSQGEDGGYDDMFLF